MKISLIFTGGTIGSGEAADGYIAPDAKKKHILLNGYDAEEFDVCEPYSILSENMDSDHLTLLLKRVKQNLAGHDGIIVTHGTDTLQYSAAASAYAFGVDTIPIVFVSSNYILSDSRANGKINFKCAYDFIKNGYGRGTFISYKNAGEHPKIHRATRVTAHSQYSDDIVSLGGEYGFYLGEEFIKNDNYRETPDAAEPFGIVDFKDKRILKLAAYPGMPPDIPVGADAVLLETYHSGTLCEKVVSGTDKRLFILGMENRTQYESTKIYGGKKNITVLNRGAAPAMYVKLKMALCSGRDKDVNIPMGGDFID